jgi:uncharacterized protein
VEQGHAVTLFLAGDAVQGGSSRARGLAPADIHGKPVEMAGPETLVRLALEHDRMFTY